nr:hypothetical protein [Leifsonia poae]
MANQDSSSIAVFSFDSATRSLDVVSLTEVPTPVCLHLL